MVLVKKTEKVEMDRAATEGRWWALRVAVLAGLVSLLACARVPIAEGPSPQPAQTAKSDAEELRERAQAYWQARFKDDMATAFTYEDPLRQKQFSLMDYIRNVGTAMKLTEVKVLDVKIVDDQADVFVEIQGRYQIPGWDTIPMDRMVIDDWQKIDGRWVHVIDLHVIRAGKPRVNPEGTVTYREPSMVVLPRKDSQ